MPLTDVAIKNAKPGQTTVKLSDGGGLQLWVQPNGNRFWYLAYRFDGRQKKLALGGYPLIGLAEARKKRDEAKKLLASGIDPGQQKKIAKWASAESRANTFGVIADEYLAKMEREGRAETTLTKTRWLLDLARPKLADRPITEISAAEALDVLRRVEARGRLESARRLRSVIGSVFRYAIATARCENDPTTALRSALTTPTVTHRAAILEPKAFGGLLRAIDAFDGQPTTVAALKLLALLFPRPGELRLARWDEFDLDARVWIIPANRAKMRREHKMPLPQQAVDILVALRKLTGHSELVFPSVRSNRRPISENTLNAALRRMGYDSTEASSHGFRASASSLLNESRLWSPDAIERQLAHVDSDGVRAAYARGAFWDERVRMLDWWSGYLDRLRTGADVVEFRRGQA